MIRQPPARILRTIQRDMVPPFPTEHDRRALLHFETVHAEWRQATEAWLAAELLLWTEAFRRPGSPEASRAGKEATRLRDTARATYLRVLDALLAWASD